MSWMSGCDPCTPSAPMHEEHPVGAPPEWQSRERPPLLSRRFQFSGYSETRGFLDAMAKLSEQQGYYPDTSFGVNYVSVTINARNGERLDSKDFEFAACINQLADLAHGVKS